MFEINFNFLDYAVLTRDSNGNLVLVIKGRRLLRAGKSVA